MMSPDADDGTTQADSPDDTPVDATDGEAKPSAAGPAADVGGDDGVGAGLARFRLREVLGMNSMRNLEKLGILVIVILVVVVGVVAITPR